ncbi:MAG: leucine-rich repeat domain-containing protein [Mycoplasmoidaceae bacterium]|nr:leucine-rich repeat domain-containing protein [Mycoplasmoidaceae bacterium]
MSGPRQTDLDGNPLFYLEPTIKDCQLLISTNIATYYFPGTYKVSITATSVLAPNVSDDITITINLIDGFYYFDDETGYTYTRSTLKENWSLSMLPSTCSAVVDVKTDIYNIPVSKVADNLCSNSGITKMTAILLPDSITEVGNSAFANQYLVYGIRMAGVKYVGESAFEGCYNMTFFQSFNQPTFYGIKAKAFKDCESLIITNSIQHKLAYIGDQAFYNTAIKSINLGEDIETVGVDSFGNCKSLSYIDIITKKPPILSGQLYSGTTNVSGIRVPLNLVEIYKKSPG